jgi:hypothetical protein
MWTSPHISKRDAREIIRKWREEQAGAATSARAEEMT